MRQKYAVCEVCKFVKQSTLNAVVEVSCSYSGTNKNNTLFARSECGGGTERLVNLIQRVCEYVVINIIFYRRIPLVVKQCIRMHLVIAGVEQTFRLSCAKIIVEFICLYLSHF